MRTLCPNVDNEDGLDTVLEVPVPEEMFKNMGSSTSKRWKTMTSLLKAQGTDKSSHLAAGSNSEFMSLLKLVGSSLLPFQVHNDSGLHRSINDSSIEASTAQYIVQQYIAATGGFVALEAIKSMYAVGQVSMSSSEMLQGDSSLHTKGKSEVGGFVLWQKDPNLWYLELVVSGFKINAGSDGNIVWNQSTSQPCHANKGPPRPLRRTFQGLDPNSIANLFLDALCIGEKTINDEDCFILKVETSSDTLKIQNTSQIEISHHTLWGYFSQKTGLLVKFEDTKLVRMKSVRGNGNVFWETSMETVIGDYKYVDGLNIAHGGKTTTTMYRYGGANKHKRRIEETWTIEEVDYNINGLSIDCFLPPADIKREHEDVEQPGECQS